MTIMTLKTEFAYLDDGQASYESSDPEDEQEVSPPSEDATVAILTVESPAIRISFDRKQRPADSGLLFAPGFHFLPFAAPFRFSSTERRAATLRIVWLRTRYAEVGGPEGKKTR